MKRYLFTAIAAVLITLTGCTASEQPDISEESANPVTENQTAGTVTTDNASPSSSDNATADTAAEEAKILYLAGILPVIEHHTETRNDLAEADKTFTLSDPQTTEDIEVYYQALSEARTRVETEYNDAYYIAPPGELSIFHYFFYTVIDKYYEYITFSLTYYDQVLKTGTGEPALFEAMNGAGIQAETMWNDHLMPQIDAMTTP